MSSRSGSTFLTQPMGEADACAGFDCGVPELNRFFEKHALENDRRGIGRTFVLRCKEPNLPPLVGFYTLSMAALEGAGLPRKLRGHLPRYPLPVALIGRLAVDSRARGKGFGDELMSDAFSRILAAAATVGCFGVIVDAKDARAIGFSQRFGFIALGEPTFPRRMFLAMATLRAAAGK